MQQFTEEEQNDNLTGQVIDDRACRKCSYNLRGLPKDGRCPECGTAIGISICGDQLRFSHPAWIRQVGDGLMLILWGLLVTFVVAIIAGIAAPKEKVIQQLLIFLGSIVGVFGTWQMTAPDPSGVGEKRGLTSRKLVRIAVLTGIVASFLQLFVAAGVASLATAGIIAACALVGVAGEFAKIHYIGILASRLPDRALMARAHLLKWALAVCYGAMVVLGFVAAMVMYSALSNAMVSGQGGSPNVGALMGGMAAAGCMMLPVGVALLVFAIMTLILIYKTATAVKAQVPIAIDLWNRAARHTREAREAPLRSAEPTHVASPASPDAPPGPNQRPYF